MAAWKGGIGFGEQERWDLDLDTRQDQQRGGGEEREGDGWLPLVGEDGGEREGGGLRRKGLGWPASLTWGLRNRERRMGDSDMGHGDAERSIVGRTVKRKMMVAPPAMACGRVERPVSEEVETEEETWDEGFLMGWGWLDGRGAGRWIDREGRGGEEWGWG